jgi:hypothetical protein
MFGIKNVENWNVWIGMREYLKLKIKIWNLYVKCLESKILKTKMVWSGMCEYLKLKIKIWNLYVKCLE